MPSIIYNSLQSAALDVIALVDPQSIDLVAIENADGLTKSVAKQMNDQRMAYTNPKQVVDLGDHIIDIRIETTVQGASFLEVHIADPAWALLARDQNGISFIDVDSDGFLWPPIEVTFPPEPASGQKWVLCQVKTSTDVTQANLILTFEDFIVTKCRDMSADPAVGGNSSLATSTSNETRAEYIRRCVKIADPGVRFIPLLNIGAPTAFSQADLTADEKAPQSVRAGRRPSHKKQPGVTDKHRLRPLPPGKLVKAQSGNVVDTVISIADSLLQAPSPNFIQHELVAGGTDPGRGTNFANHSFQGTPAP